MTFFVCVCYCCCHSFILYSFYICSAMTTECWCYCIDFSLWISRQNCTADQQPPYSNACIFDCIENLYDKKYCNVCSVNTHPIKLNQTEILASLIHYDYVRYDKKKQSIVSFPTCSGKNKFLILKIRTKVKIKFTFTIPF